MPQQKRRQIPVLGQPGFGRTGLLERPSFMNRSGLGRIGKLGKRGRKLREAYFTGRDEHVERPAEAEEHKGAVLRAHSEEAAERKLAKRIIELRRINSMEAERLEELMQQIGEALEQEQITMREAHKLLGNFFYSNFRQLSKQEKIGSIKLILQNFDPEYVETQHELRDA